MIELKDLLHIPGSSRPFEDSRKVLDELGSQDPAVIHPTDGQLASGSFQSISPLGGQHVGETLPPITTTTPEGEELATQLEILAKTPITPSEAFSWNDLLRIKQEEKRKKREEKNDA